MQTPGIHIYCRRIFLTLLHATCMAFNLKSESFSLTTFDVLGRLICPERFENQDTRLHQT